MKRCLRQTQIVILFTISTLVGSLFIPLGVRAQDSGGLTLSVTPPLFQIGVQRGDVFKSSIKVVNPNPYELTLFAEPVNFAPQGEEGRGSFLPLIDAESDELTLGQWIELERDLLVIPAESSRDVTLIVTVPDDAPPGGHFAAILIGTQPFFDSAEGPQVRTSQVVSSLFFVRVEGDVIEDGIIREFSAEENFYQEPEASFLLRFENKGNVHLQPQGDITIFNMWGQERGFIPINQKTHFGQVLPESVRRFAFDWTGESNRFEFGRYKAVATLTYGQDIRKNETRVTYFWVVPVKAASITLSLFLVFTVFITWAIRRYIRRALTLATGVEQTEYVPVKAASRRQQTTSGELNLKTLARPISEGVVDMRAIADAGNDESVTYFAAFKGFIRKYRLFLGSTFVIVIGFVGVGFFFAEVFTKERSYDVVVRRTDGDIPISSEQLIKEEIEEDDTKEEEVVIPQEIQNLAEELSDEQRSSLSISVTNSSGKPGTAAEAAVLLEKLGFVVSDVANNLEEENERSVVIYTEGNEQEALVLSKIFNDALISARSIEARGSSTPAETNNVTVIIGNDSGL